MVNPSENSTETSTETEKETLINPEINPEKKGDNTTQQPDTEKVSQLMAGLNIKVRVPNQDNGNKPANPFGEKPSEVVDLVSDQTHSAGDVIEGFIDGDSSDLDLESAELVAETLIEGTDTALSFTGQLAVGDFSDDLDKRYSMPKERKERLKKPLAKLLMKRGSKISPEVAFTILAIVYMLPVIIKIIGDVMEKRKKKKALAEAEEKKALEMNIDGTKKDPSKGGRPPKCRNCKKPKTNKAKPSDICKCVSPDFSGN